MTATSAPASTATAPAAPTPQLDPARVAHALPLTLVLGSTSRARRALLASLIPPTHKDRIRIEFTAPPDSLDERAVAADHRAAHRAHDLTLAVAHAKADALLDSASLAQTGTAILLTADQVTVCAGKVREKPESEQEARGYLAAYSAGEPATTVTAVVATHLPTKKRVAGIDVATQHWRGPFLASVVEEVIAKGDVMHCCGGFMIDEPLLMSYLGQRDGDGDSIMGMPLALTKSLIEQLLDFD
ncbi:hypothetical protein AMAG_16095 [Allomyces macrogynus ATCC 38327]|uniref:Septum formation protein Maf n=1 Tax=Allomyces macrogynus (strain ATCC 38327) TaxID=578462 RepID=A0A0L0TAE2_ALLM3|nr:hypothetical protein AMAG_16095 [Allomyces macrogynus ATCC 38327]|eukprot:KNE71788.1 hypothetical protein AMAG_16095 [Allomyces macrogynus ATCC 38327]